MIPVEKLQEAGLGSRGSLRSQKAQRAQDIVQILQIHFQVHHPQGGPLSHSGGLGRLEVGEGQGGQILILFRKARQLSQHIDQLLSHQLQRLRHNNDIRIVAHIAGGGAQMDDSLCLRALHSIGVDMAHHIMANLFLTRLCHIVVDILRVGL